MNEPVRLTEVIGEMQAKAIARAEGRWKNMSLGRSLTPYERQKRWTLKNLETVRAGRRRYYWRHRERLNLERSQRYSENIDIKAWNVIRYKKHKLNITKEDFLRWYGAQVQKCTYCDLADLSLDMKLTRGRKTYRFTIDRKDSSRPYEAGNLCLACWRCNKAKGDYFSFEEFMIIGQQIIKKRLESGKFSVAA